MSKETSIVTFSRDLVSGKQISRSDFNPCVDQKRLELILDQIIEIITPATRTELEVAFKEEPDSITYKDFHEIAVSEWETLLDNKILGTRSVRGQYGEMERVWYIRKII